MKNYSLFLRFTILLSVAAVFFNSCKKETGKEYSYFVSKDLLISYDITYIHTLFESASVDYPDINDLKPLVETDVNVYSLVYSTTINNEEVNASGLLCVPVDEGEYPVLCFHNGTNTVDAYAPSNFVLNPLYQMVEVIASIGYCVIIPDYPGFGESAHLVHPYLIAEPTVQSIVDMLYAVNELGDSELPGFSIKNEYYLLGYSQGGWAAFAMHKALELDYASDFNLGGSACGAGPYNLSLLFQEMTNEIYYPMPVYIGYIVNAYSAYNQFSNPVTDILNEPFASALSSLYTGTLSSDQINNQLTTSIPELFTADFLAGFASEPEYSAIREALANNSISAWNSTKPLYFIHGENDTHVSPLTTENIYDAMIQAGTSPATCIKEIVPGVDHGDGIVPCMLKGLFFIMSLGK